jgi:hypothetical protein
MHTHRWSRRPASAGLALLAAAAGLVVGTQAASAAAAAAAGSSPAGSYTATLIVPKSPPATDSLTLTAKGHFSFEAGPKGRWTESGDVVTMTGKLEKTTWVFTIDQHGTNLGSKAHPGKVTADGHKVGKWYATQS